jgi:hypothetical protein
VFHDTAAKAAAEGFRACKRCRPEFRDGEGDPQKIAVEKACDLIRKEQPGSENGKWNVKALATEVGLTESHFCRIFKKVMGMTVGEYRACIFPENTRNLSDVAYKDQTHEVGVLKDSGGSYPTPNLPSDIRLENWLLPKDFDSQELEQDWHQFNGVLPSMAMFSSPHVHLNLTHSDRSSPDPFSDSINAEMMDDGFQFLDFDNIH